jgi:hypothetical protein
MSRTTAFDEFDCNILNALLLWTRVQLHCYEKLFPNQMQGPPTALRRYLTVCVWSQTVGKEAGSPLTVEQGTLSHASLWGKKCSFTGVFWGLVTSFLEHHNCQVSSNIITAVTKLQNLWNLGCIQKIIITFPQQICDREHGGNEILMFEFELKKLSLSLQLCSAITLQLTASSTTFWLSSSFLHPELGHSWASCDVTGETCFPQSQLAFILIYIPPRQHDRWSWLVLQIQLLNFLLLGCLLSTFLSCWGVVHGLCEIFSLWACWGPLHVWR